MRILMLTQCYSPLLGGQEQHIRTLNVELVARGHDVVVVTQLGEGLVPFEVDCGIRIYRIRTMMNRMPWLFPTSDTRRYAPPFPDPELTQGLRRVIVRERPQIVHVHNWLGRSFLPLKQWSKARLVVTLHDYGLACPKISFLHQGSPCGGPQFLKCIKCASEHYGLKGMPISVSNQIMSQIERNKADMYLPVSEAVARNNGLVGSGVPFQVIPNFLQESDETQQVDVTPHLTQLPGEGYLLFVGALAKWKGVHVLLRAYRALKNAPPLVLIGYKLAGWEELISDLPPNVFVFTDWPHEAVMEAWRRCSIALIPSTGLETFGIVAIEAMRMGKPTIASRRGGLSDVVVDNETGLLIPPNDPDALLRAIQRLLDDRPLLERMGMMARQRSTQYLASSVVPRIEQVYQDVLS